MFLSFSKYFVSFHLVLVPVLGTGDENRQNPILTERPFQQVLGSVVQALVTGTLFTHPGMFPPPQRMLMLSAPRSWGEAGHLVIRARTRMSRGCILQSLENCTHTATWENLRPSFPWLRGVCMYVKKADGEQASKHQGWITHALKIHCSTNLIPKLTVRWTKGYVEIVPLNLSHLKRLCFLLKGFCNAAHSSSHKAILLFAKPIFMVRFQNKCKIVLASDELSLSLATGTPSASWVGTVNTVG